MTATPKGRRRQAVSLMSAVTQWASGLADVSALPLVGSYAYNQPRMGGRILQRTSEGNHLEHLIDSGQVGGVAGVEPSVVRVSGGGDE